MNQSCLYASSFDVHTMDCLGSRSCMRSTFFQEIKRVECNGVTPALRPGCDNGRQDHHVWDRQQLQWDGMEWK
jgi:hypothetical protein